MNFEIAVIANVPLDQSRIVGRGKVEKLPAQLKEKVIKLINVPGLVNIHIEEETADSFFGVNKKVGMAHYSLKDWQMVTGSHIENYVDEFSKTADLLRWYFSDHIYQEQLPGSGQVIIFCSHCHGEVVPLLEWFNQMNNSEKISVRCQRTSCPSHEKWKAII